MYNYFIKIIFKNILLAIFYFKILPKIFPNNLYLQFIISFIIVELLFNNINLVNLTGGEPNLCKVICSSEDNPKMCEKICNENNYITTDLKGGNINDTSEINLICRNICKNNKYNINCVKNCEIDFNTI